MEYHCRGRRLLPASRPLVMGILNVTPDSFSEQGMNRNPETAVRSGCRMAADGADIIDVGGESTRPGADSVPAPAEIDRVVPVIAALREQLDLPISIDTTKSAVARAALAAGADIVNDVSGFVRDPEMAAVAAEFDAGCVVMHMRGTPANMKDLCCYADIFGEMNAFFADAVVRLEAAGVAWENICLDPGIGFSKTAAQSRLLIGYLDRFLVHGRPLLLGPSRKSFIGHTLGIENPREREWGTAAALVCGIVRGARILRVHNVRAMRQVCDMTMAILDEEGA